MLIFKYVIYYLICGTLFVLMMDGIANFLGNPKTKFNNKERGGMMMMWPVGLIIFVYNFVSSWFNNNNNT